MLHAGSDISRDEVGRVPLSSITQVHKFSMKLISISDAIKSMKMGMPQQTAVRKQTAVMKLKFQRKLSSFIDFIDFLTAKLAKKPKTPSH